MTIRNFFEKKPLSICTFLLSFILISGQAFAQLVNEDLPKRRGVKADPLIVHAAQKTSVQFDTNIFLSDKDAKYDMITLVNPSFGLELPIRDHRVSVEYDVGFNFFGKYVHQNYQDHRVRGLVEVNFTNHKLVIENIYKQFSSRAGSEDTNRVRQQNNDLNVILSGEYNRLQYEVEYDMGVEAYISKDLIYQNLAYKDKDRVTNEITGRVKYRFLPKTSVVFEQSLGFLNYYSPLSSSSYYVETMAGLEGKLKEKLLIKLKAGLRYQDYDHADLSTSKDFMGLVVRGGVNYNITERDMLDLSLERGVYESTYDNINYYTLNFIGLQYSHKFTRKLMGILSGAYQFNQYPSQTYMEGLWATRYDHFFRAGCALRYDLKDWIAFEAKYDYNQRESRFSTFDYVDHLFTLSGTVGF